MSVTKMQYCPVPKLIGNSKSRTYLCLGISFFIRCEHTVRQIKLIRRITSISRINLIGIKIVVTDSEIQNDLFVLHFILYISRILIRMDFINSHRALRVRNNLQLVIWPGNFSRYRINNLDIFLRETIIFISHINSILIYIMKGIKSAYF